MRLVSGLMTWKDVRKGSPRRRTQVTARQQPSLVHVLAPADAAYVHLPRAPRVHLEVAVVLVLRAEQRRGLVRDSLGGVVEKRDALEDDSDSMRSDGRRG